MCWTIVDGEALYKWYLGAIPFISNVGAVHKTFFMTGCVITALFYSASLLAERYLRTKVRATFQVLMIARLTLIRRTASAGGGHRRTTALDCDGVPGRVCWNSRRPCPGIA